MVYEGSLAIAALKRKNEYLLTYKSNLNIIYKFLLLLNNSIYFFMSPTNPIAYECLNLLRFSYEDDIESLIELFSLKGRFNEKYFNKTIYNSLEFKTKDTNTFITDLAEDYAYLYTVSASNSITDMNEYEKEEREIIAKIYIELTLAKSLLESINKK